MCVYRNRFLDQIKGEGKGTQPYQLVPLRFVHGLSNKYITVPSHSSTSDVNHQV